MSLIKTGAAAYTDYAAVTCAYLDHKSKIQEMQAELDALKTEADYLEDVRRELWELLHEEPKEEVKE